MLLAAQMGQSRWVGLEIFRHLSNLGIDVVDELLDGHDGLLAPTLWTDGNGAIGSFLLAYDNHVGDTLELVVANLTTELLVAKIDGGTNASGSKLLANLLGIVVVLLGQGQDGHLLGSEPEGEVAAGMLDEHSGEALQ